MHKIILLHKTTQLTPLTLLNLVDDRNGNVTDDTLTEILQIKLYEQYDTIKEPQARILAGLKISQTAVNGELSQYDQLFNNPPLYGQKFVPDDKDYDIAPSAQNIFKSNLKQAFAVNDQELYQMLLLFKDDNYCKNDLATTSVFYSLYLLTSAFHLTVAELTILLNLLNYKNIPSAELISKLNTTVAWLNKQNLKVALTTDNFDTNQSPEIENLIITLRSNLDDRNLSDNALKTALAPYFASQLALSSADITYQLLIWLDNIKIRPEDLDTNQFWQQISNINIDQPFTLTPTAIRYCHRIAQLALITNLFKLLLAEVTLIVNQPEHLKKALTKVYLTVNNLQFINQFHDWTILLATQAPVAITSLGKDQLTVSMLAKAINAPVDEYTAAAQQVDKLATSDTIVSDVQQGLFIQQWYQAGKTLAVDATVVGSLYDPTNNYPLTLSSLQLQTQVPIDRLTNAIAALTRDYNPGSGDYSYQAAIINNNDDIALWYLDNEERNPGYILLLYPLGNNQFKIKAKIFDWNQDKQYGWAYETTSGIQYLGDAKKISENEYEYELPTLIDWTTLKIPNEITIVKISNLLLIKNIHINKKATYIQQQPLLTNCLKSSILPSQFSPI